MSDETTSDAESADSRTPLDAALDLTVFAPLGFALECRRVVPELAEVGRRQIAFSRSLGRAALRTLARSAATSPSTTAKPDDAAGADATAVAAVPDDYDGLTAREIIARCADASAPELAAMREQELRGKARKTVLAELARRLDP